MKKINIKDILEISAIGILLILAILNPIIAAGTLVFLIPISIVNNKIFYENKKSDMFKISRVRNKDGEKSISQKMGKSIIKSFFIKNKNEYFSKNLINLLENMNENEKYTTVSQAIVLQGLKELEKLGYIESLEVKGKAKKDTFINSLLENVGTGNFSKIGKKRKKYNISFMRTDKNLTKEDSNKILKRNELPENKEDNPEYLHAFPSSEKLKEIQSAKKDLESMQQTVNIISEYKQNENINQEEMRR